jgi:integrase
VAGPGPPTPPARSRGASPRRPASDGGLPRTSRATPTPSSWRARGVPLNVVQRQLGHTTLGVTSIYPQGIDNAEIIATVHARKVPMIPASAGLRI